MRNANEIDLLGMDPRAHRRNEVPHRNLILVEQRDDPRQSDARAVFLLRKRADRGLTEPDAHRLVVHVEQEQRGDASAVEPLA